jgi:hypothetical protein
MKAICDQNHIQFLILVIPTKESVFSPLFEPRSELALSHVIREVAFNERLARQKTFEFCKDNAIPYVDALPALQAAMEHELYARKTCTLVATDTKSLQGPYSRHWDQKGRTVIPEILPNGTGEQLPKSMSDGSRYLDVPGPRGSIHLAMSCKRMYQWDLPDSNEKPHNARQEAGNVQRVAHSQRTNRRMKCATSADLAP